MGHVWPKAIVVNSMFVKFQQHCVAILTDVIVVVKLLVITHDAITDIIQETDAGVRSSESNKSTSSDDSVQNMLFNS